MGRLRQQDFWMEMANVDSAHLRSFLPSYWVSFALYLVSFAANLNSAHLRSLFSLHWVSFGFVPRLFCLCTRSLLPLH